MDLYQSTDGPTLDQGLQARLKRIDPNLRVTFSQWAIDTATSRPVIYKYTGAPIPDPAHHLWIWSSRESRYFHINSFSMSQGGFTHRNAQFLEQDAGRRMKPSALLQQMLKVRDQKREREKAAHDQLQQDKIRENKKRIHDLVFENKQSVRQAKIVSHGGQSNRGLRGNVEMDAKEAGWYLPEPKESEHG